MVCECQAQHDALTQILVEEMGVGDKYRIHLFEGTLEQHHQIRMVLATKDTECRGLYEFVNSGVIFKLVGTIDTLNQIELVELDNSDVTSGFLRGNYDNVAVYLTWKNLRGLNKLDLSLKPVDRFSKVISKTEESLLHLVSSHFNQNIELLIDRKRKSIHVEGRNFPSMSFQFECATSNCDRIMSNSLPREKKYWKYEAFSTNEDKLSMNFHHVNGTKTMFIGKVKERIYSKHKTFADYRVLVDLEYPISEYIGFNRWIEAKINDLHEQTIDEVYDHILDDAGDIPDERYQFESYSWYDIDCISEEIISGTLIYTKSWSKQTKTVAFIYEIDSGKMLEINDLFDSEFDHAKYISSFVRKEKNQLKKTKENDQYKWMMDGKYDNISIGKSGLICSSDYNMIYGDNRIIIPFSEIKDYLKNKSIIKVLSD